MAIKVGGTTVVDDSRNLTNVVNGTLTGSLGIGTAATGSTKVRMGGSITGNSSQFGFYNDGTFQSDVTTTGQGFTTALQTQAAAFTLGNMVHFSANQSTFGAGSTVTIQYGFQSAPSLTGATNNFGFYGGIAAGTGRYNLYMAGSADNYLAGKLSLGTTSPGAVQFANFLPITGSTNAYSNTSNPTVASDVINSAVVYNTYVGTQAAAFTLGNLHHYLTGQGTIGAGSAVTNQYGFNAQASLTGATNNYGFIGAIAAGTGRYNLYMAGTADNYLAGKLGIGTSSPSYRLDITAESVGTALGNQTIAQQIQVNSGNADKLEISNIRTVAGTSWDSAGFRLQQIVDATWMAYIQFNGSDTSGNKNQGGISFGTGLTSSSANAVVERMRLNNYGALSFGSTPSYGTAGQVLTSAGSGAVPTWSDIPSTNLASGVTGTLPVANGGTGVTTSTGSGSTVLSTSPTLVTPILGTPTSGTLTSCTGLPLSTGVTGTLPVANGGTGVTTSTGSGSTVLSTSPTLTTPTITGLKETKVAMAASAVDLATGNYFSKTISGATSLTVSNVPATGTVGSFVLDLTNGGSAVITWWTGVKWVGGTAPTLTTSGRDVLTFFTHDGGTTWNGFVVGKDVK